MQVWLRLVLSCSLVVLFGCSEDSEEYQPPPRALETRWDGVWVVNSINGVPPGTVQDLAFEELGAKTTTTFTMRFRGSLREYEFTERVLFRSVTTLFGVVELPQNTWMSIVVHGTYSLDSNRFQLRRSVVETEMSPSMERALTADDRRELQRSAETLAEAILPTIGGGWSLVGSRLTIIYDDDRVLTFDKT